MQEKNSKNSIFTFKIIKKSIGNIFIKAQDILGKKINANSAAKKKCA